MQDHLLLWAHLPASSLEAWTQGALKFPIFSHLGETQVECKYLTSVAPRVPPPLVLLLLRTLQRASINSEYKESLPDGRSRGLPDLMSHEKNIEKSVERREAFLAYLPVVSACVGDKYSQADLWVNFCRC